MIKSFQYYLEEAGYRISRTMRWMQGKVLQVSLRTAMGGGAAAVATKLSPAVHDAMNVSVAAQSGAQAALTTGEILMSSVGGLVGVGAGVGISAYLNHMEYKHNEKQLCELYRPQIGSILGKSPGLVTVEDLHTVAAGNPTLQTELDRNKSDRFVKNSSAILGTVAAFGAVFAAIALAPVVLPWAATAAAAGFATLQGATFLLGAGALGYATHQFARNVVSKIGRKMTGLNEPSVEDKIRFLSKQNRSEQGVEPERVLDVFLTAKPELGEAVKSEYGKPFGKMSAEERRTVLRQYDAELGISGIVDALKNGQMNPRELAFAAHGQSSGVYPDEPWQDRFKEAAQEKLDPLQDKLSNSVDKFQEWRTTRRQNKLQDDVVKAIEEGKPLPEKAQQIGNETYWRDTINARREAEKATTGPARA